MLGSLYPEPMPVDDVHRAGRASPTSPIAGPTSCPAARPSASGSPLALVADPRLLVLDEPTVALDVEARRAFWATMRGFAAGGRTVVFATHYLEEADAFADRIVLMANGRIVADGSATEIKARVGRPH